MTPLQVQDRGDLFMESPFIETANFILTKERNVQIQYLDFVDSDPGEVGLKMETKLINIPTFQVSSKNTKETERDMEVYFNSPLEDSIIPVLKQETTYNAERALLKQYTEKALKFPLKKLQSVLARIFPKMEFPAYISSYKDTRKAILMMMSLLSLNSRRGRGDFLVVPNELVSFIQDDPGFIYNTDHTPISINPVREIGKWNGLRCFVSPFMNGEILLGSKIKDEGGFFIYKGFEITKEESDNYKMLILRSHFTPYVTLPSFYLTRKVKVGKNPLWRRFLGV